MFIQTFDGNLFYPAVPEISEISIADIAHHLSNICRFNGAVRRFYSVAQHCVLVSEILPDPLKLAGLLHDGSEAYVNDMVKPLKNLLHQYASIEDDVSECIEKHFNVDFSDPRIKEADLQLLATERRDLMKVIAEPWPQLAGINPLGTKIIPMDPEKAKRAFLARYCDLTGSKFDPLWMECID